jgi:hypothetical protein
MLCINCGCLLPAVEAGPKLPFGDAQLLDDGLQLRVGGGGDAGAHVHQAAGVVEVACGTCTDSSTVTVSLQAVRHPLVSGRLRSGSSAASFSARVLAWPIFNGADR